jgi:Holliday junction resolvase RusA-like endonuclease
MSSITINVEGVKPAPQGSKTAMMIGGKPRVIEGSSTSGRAAHKAFRAAIVAECAIWRADNGNPPPLDEPLFVTASFRFPQIKAKRRYWHFTKPDLDKLLRSLLDGLVDGQVILNDSRVAMISVSKIHTDESPGVSVLILTFDEQETD